MVPLIHLLAFTGGFVIMSVELLGGKILAPYFGSGVYVWGSIITVFMLSLSLGYLLGGKLSVNNPSLTRFASIFGLGRHPAVSTDPVCRTGDGIHLPAH
jgi:hypothetical protein